MDKTYNPNNIENKWYQIWESNNYFKPIGAGKSYTIVIPPPNVTGTLHMGHGFQYSLMDVLIRYHRMDGDYTLWQVGTDHAGIATQMVVERNLLKQNIKRHDLGREKFIEKIWEWRHESGNIITEQMRRMGASVDWSRERFTMDEGLSQAVREVFIKLFDEGLIYRGKRLVNWDPVLLTAISDLEVISQEENGHLWYIRYPIVESKEYIIVATTRPETMLGDVAVAVNPNDSRYQHLIGKYVALPLTDRRIPIIADDYVDSEFGTGCVKITPAHDFNDNQVGERHDLPLINIFTPQAKINEHAPVQYQGLDRYEAREKIIADLQQANLIEKIEPHVLKVPRGDRSGSVIEPYLTDQWFVKAKPLAEPAIAAVEKGDIKFVPENWNKTYFNWLNNIEDWCISRQLWWGHQVPAWYDEQGNIYVAHTEEQAREKYNLPKELKLKQDEDVLDTWFSSALWPFSTLGWPNDAQQLAKFYPTSVLVTGFDIIFFWVARMVMMGLKFTGQVPFHEVYITGLIRDQEGQKMSKSKGNILDPIDLIDGIDLESLVTKRTESLMQPQMAKKIEKQTREQFPQGIAAHGTDALRFTFCSLASTGRDIRFDLSRLDGYKNFCNKIWNAARYVLMNTENETIVTNPAHLQMTIADQWIIAKLQQLISTTRHHLDHYRFDLAAQALHEFTWYEYCDWYLELSKPILNGTFSAGQKLAARYTLVHVLETLMRLLHPFMPFLTEEIWQKLAPMLGNSGETLVLQPFPHADESLIKAAVIEDVEWLKSAILGVRNIRGEMNIAPGKLLPTLIYNANETEKRRLNENKEFLQALAKIESITCIDDKTTAPACATSLVGNMEILVPLAGLIDKAAESQRLQKEIAKLEAELKKCAAKLENSSFVDKAPAAVVEQEKQRQQEFSNALEKLQTQLQSLNSL